MDFSLSAAERALQAEAREFCEDASSRYPTSADCWMVGRSPELSLELGQRGWLGMTWPVEVGGAGRSNLDRLLVAEQLIAHGLPIAHTWFADRQIGPALLEFGNDEQRARYLPGILSGRDSWSIGISEPNAGSDVAAIATRAAPAGRTFRVTGQKVWTSGAHEADYLYLICRTDPDAPPHKGLSELVVPMAAEGITVAPIRDLTGSEHFNEVFLDDVAVPQENLVGALNGSFRQVMRQLDHERGGIDRLVSNRVVLDQVIATCPEGAQRQRHQLAAVHTRHTIGRLLVMREAAGQAPAGFSAATKAYCTELEQQIAQLCTAVLGPAAMAGSDELHDAVSRALCYSSAYTVMGGTSEVLRNILGERVLGLPR